MKKSELKEYIKKSILEGDYLEDDKDAMDAMDNAMVQDYEEEEANKFALDKEEPMEEATISPDNRVAYLQHTLDMVWKLGKGNNPVNFKSLAQSTVSHMFDEEPMEEVAMDPIAEADAIVEAWNSKKKLTEEMHGGYLELFEMDPNFEKAIELLDQAWEQWKNGPATEPEDIQMAREDMLAYLSNMLK